MILQETSCRAACDRVRMTNNRPAGHMVFDRQQKEPPLFAAVGNRAMPTTFADLNRELDADGKRAEWMRLQANVKVLKVLMSWSRLDHLLIEIFKPIGRLCFGRSHWFEA